MMKPTLIPVTLLAFTLFVAVGCGQGQGQSEARRALDQAMQQLEVANRGFVPVGQPEGTTYQAYRLDQISQAVEPLQTAMKSGDGAVKAAAAQLLSDIYAAQARDAAREAGHQAAALTSRSVTTVSLLLAADASRNQSVIYDSDAGPIVAQLQQQAQQFASQRQASETKLDQLQATSKQLADEQKKLDAQRDRLLEQARAKRQEAFTETGQDAVDLYTAASELEQKASNLQAKQRNLAAQQSGVDKQASTLSIEVNVLEDARKKLTDRASDTRGFAQARTKLSQEAAQQRDTHVASLTQSLDAIAADFSAQVQPLYTQAREASAKAVSALEVAVAAAPAPRKDELKLQLVGAMMHRLDIMTSEFQALAGYAETFALASDNAPRIAPSRAAAIAEAYSKVATIRDQIKAEATSVIEQATNLATELTDGGDDIAQLAEERKADLERYANAMNPA